MRQANNYILIISAITDISRSLLTTKIPSQISQEDCRKPTERSFDDRILASPYNVSGINRGSILFDLTSPQNLVLHFQVTISGFIARKCSIHRTEWSGFSQHGVSQLEPADWLTLIPKSLNVH